MYTELQLLNATTAHRDREIRQEITDNQLAGNLSQPTLGSRVISTLGHSLVNLGQQLEQAAKPKAPAFHGPKTGQLHA
ncbi:hypothetical protein [Dictyobacter kobayashii]|uniref:Uncharacterized protein n=1 Tax=Dictyobacter kobayashii TaxID=2014872 RepID=A0A402AL80_9CHLR|nr:hypothetical protein [Dictyobacter kobayashii]GCE19809.1 hypothetical protein KDK_36090 [Dictyobacter kobayashii]